MTVLCVSCRAPFDRLHKNHRFCSAECRKIGVRFGPIRAELESSLDALALGREHLPLVESCRRLANVVDGQGRECPECGIAGFDDKLWREWRLLLSKLLEQGGAGEGSKSFDDIVESFRRAAVHDTENPGS